MPAKTETGHIIRPYTRTSIAATSFECRECGAVATTPRGFTGDCDG